MALYIIKDAHATSALCGEGTHESTRPVFRTIDLWMICGILASHRCRQRARRAAAVAASQWPQCNKIA